MQPRWERSTAPPVLEGKLFLDAVLHPHRSLSLAAFRAMLITVIAVNAAVATFFVAQGAYPVAGFLGLDVLALWLAFRWNYHAAQATEYVRVARGKVHVASVDKDGVATHWTLNPIWARVARDGLGVLIRDGAGQLRIGAFLSPKECAQFAAALDAALHKAKRGG
jgi:uncharacterized membrane protein